MTSSTNSPEEVREKIVSAIMANLHGPMYCKGPKYPTLNACPYDGENVDDNKNVQIQYSSVDGEEIIRNPKSRYMIGVLHPQNTTAIEELDLDEELDVDESNALIPNPGGDELFPIDLDPDEVDAGEVDDRSLITNQSSIAITFAIKRETILNVFVEGGVYEELPHSSDTKSHRIPWKRSPLSIGPETFETASPKRNKHVIGNLHLEVGLERRRTLDDRLSIVTIYLRNISTSSSRGMVSDASYSLFQTKLTIRLPKEDFEETGNPYPLSDRAEWSNQLLFRERHATVAGHGCDTEICHNDSTTEIMSKSLPLAKVPATAFDIYDDNGREIHITMDSVANWTEDAQSKLKCILQKYISWIIEQREKASAITDESLRRVAMSNLKICDQFYLDAFEGFNFAMTDPLVQKCLMLTSKAMATQQRAYKSPTRSATDHLDSASIGNAPPAIQTIWRPFQIIYLLSFIKKTLSSSSEKKSEVDLIWMPTGGGKTEAYLGATAFTIIWNRFADTLYKEIGTVVIMRYTLRLLTTQQFQRAASLICALEAMRADKEIDGKEKITIGAWLGNAATPNTREEAVEQLNKYKNGRSEINELPFLLVRCPYCATSLFRDDEDRESGFSVQNLKDGTKRVQVACLNYECPFNSRLPIYEVDEDLYEKHPTLLLATVDKFAMLAWQERARTFFGINDAGERASMPPSLIIQDELHLIDGPLGSNVALFENTVSYLCNYKGGKSPLIIASTATTKNYQKQIENLFATKYSRLVPPAGIDIEDNFFSREDHRIAPRIYLGISSNSNLKFARVITRVVATLAHIAGTLQNFDPTVDAALIDGYWTNMLFFTSLRELGIAKSAIETNEGQIHQHISRITNARSGSFRDVHEGTYNATRFLKITELTSASTKSSTSAIEALSRAHQNDHSVKDVVLATSVIEVGVDIERLGLMTVVHQPKTTTSYIQATGRVGRNVKVGPGLVVVLLDGHRRRDMSFLERFSSFHRRIYALVEPASITPYAYASLRHGLRSVIASAIRQTRMIGSNPISRDDLLRAEEVVEFLVARSINTQDQEAIKREWEIASGSLNAAANQDFQWGTLGQSTESRFLITADETKLDHFTRWTVPTSMRNVENGSGVAISTLWAPKPTNSKAPDSEARESDDEEEF